MQKWHRFAGQFILLGLYLSCQPSSSIQDSSPNQKDAGYRDSEVVVDILGDDGRHTSDIAPSLDVAAPVDGTQPDLASGDTGAVDAGSSDAPSSRFDGISEDVSCLDHCTNSSLDCGETDLDCGGPCQPCAANSSCLQPVDCQSNICHNQLCWPVDTCGNGLCENFEGVDNCPGDCPSVCIAQGFRQVLNTIWNDNKRQYYTTQIQTFANHVNSTVLYSVQMQTNPLLWMADFCNDSTVLDELAELYLTALPFLESSGTDRISSYCQHNLSPPQRMWIDDDVDYEVVLESSQFLYAVANTIRIFAQRAAGQRSAVMETFVDSYLQVVVQDHYHRWVFGPGKFQVAGWGCQDRTCYNHSDFLTKKLHRQLGPEFIYCNSVTDTDAWIVAGVVEILAAHASDPVLVPLSAAQKDLFLAYIGVATALLESRGQTTQPTNFAGQPVAGSAFFLGEWDDYGEHGWAGYTGTTFPTEADRDYGSNVGWDISHGRRFVQVFDTLFRHRKVTGQSFPNAAVMHGLANQYAYQMFNGDLVEPIFFNFMDGSNGWYRVNTTAQTGYAPSSLSFAGASGGYGFWGRYNPDIYRISRALWSLLETPNAHTSAYFPGFDLTTSARTLQFLASFARPTKKVVSISFDDGSATDSSGSFNHGTIDGATAGSGANGQGLHFDGDDHVLMVDDASLLTHFGSVSFWLQLGSTNEHYEDIVNIFENGYYDFFLVRKLASGKIGVLIEDDDQQVVWLHSAQAILDTDWHHVAITQDGTALKIYIDGQNSGATGTNSGFFTGHLNNTTTWLGRGHWEHQLTGAMDEFRMYNYALTDQQVGQVMAGAD